MVAVVAAYAAPANGLLRPAACAETIYTHTDTQSQSQPSVPSGASRLFHVPMAVLRSCAAWPSLLSFHQGTELASVKPGERRENGSLISRS